MLSCDPAGKIISGDRTAVSQRSVQGFEQGDFRTRFIVECAEHLSAEAVADSAERLDDYIQSLWLESLLANRLGLPSPHPWFVEFCLRYTNDIGGLVRDNGPPASG